MHIEAFMKKTNEQIYGISSRVPRWVVKAIKEEAMEQGWSMSQVIRKLLEAHYSIKYQSKGK